MNRGQHIWVKQVVIALLTIISSRLLHNPILRLLQWTSIIQLLFLDGVKIPNLVIRFGLSVIRLDQIGENMVICISDADKMTLVLKVKSVGIQLVYFDDTQGK